jgi:hypothetical protein
VVVYRNNLHATLKCNFQIMPGGAWLKLLLKQVPDRCEHLVAYYGWYSNRSRGERKVGNLEVGLELELELESTPSTPTPETDIEKNPKSGR